MMMRLPVLLLLYLWTRQVVMGCKSPDYLSIFTGQHHISSPKNRPLSPEFDFMEYVNSKSKINNYNRLSIIPKLKSLVSKDYFRYVKINLNRPCKLWCITGGCNSRACEVKRLSDPDKCPMRLNNDEDDLSSQSRIVTEEDINNAALSEVNTELDDDQRYLLIKLYECNESDDPDSQYIDLTLNPERYTGYSGEEANRVWRAIYDENCFIRKKHSPLQQDLCFEEKLFYESISGLHSSINIHLCAEYPAKNPLTSLNQFEPNAEEFCGRFLGHMDYLENLYTLYQLQLRALVLSRYYLLDHVIWPDQSTKVAVNELLDVVDVLETPKYEQTLSRQTHVSHELALHFRNITTSIMDCVACDKCKLWGKVQIQGLGVAFKILSVADMKKLHLNQQEIVTLVNAITRLSHSVGQLETFQNLVLRNAKAKRTKFNKRT